MDAAVAEIERDARRREIRPFDPLGIDLTSVAVSARELGRLVSSDDQSPDLEFLRLDCRLAACRSRSRLWASKWVAAPFSLWSRQTLQTFGSARFPHGLSLALVAQFRRALLAHVFDLDIHLALLHRFDHGLDRFGQVSASQGQG